MESIVPSSQTANTHNCLLLSKLPGEIRNSIYRLVLVSSNTIIIKASTIRRQRSVLQTCHQVREEASKIYYGENTFTIDSNLTNIHVNTDHRNTTDMRNITRFICEEDKSIGRMISKLIVVHKLEATQMIKLEQFAAAVYLRSNLADGQKRIDELQEMVAKSGTVVGRELMHIGIPQRAITVVLPEKNWSDELNDILREMCDIFATQVRAEVEMDDE